MDLQEWRKKREGELWTLPSGLVIKLRRLQLLDLVELGQIPMPLVSIANELITNDHTDLTAENWATYSEVFDVVVKACAVDPPIADEPDETHIGIRELSVADRLAIYNWASSVVVAVIPFRSEPNGNGAAKPSGEGLQPTAEPNARD